MTILLGSEGYVVVVVVLTCSLDEISVSVEESSTETPLSKLN